jgi:hypothetical protein
MIASNSIALASYSSPTDGLAVSPSAEQFVVWFVRVTSVSGASPSATVKLQDSPDGANWYDVDTVTLTAAGSTRRSVSGTFGQYLRASISEITGTFTLEVWIVTR